MSISYFPTELLKLIAINLCDKDLCNFSLTCRIFHDAVHGDQIVWRGRFLAVYDVPVKSRKNVYDWRWTYQARQRLLLRELKQIEFTTGTSDKELEALEVLQGLLLDAHGHLSSDAQTITGCNFAHIISAHPSFPTLSRLHSTPLLQAISLLLTPLLPLTPSSHIPGLQSIIYNPNLEPSTTTTTGHPNLRALSALSRFFTYHIHAHSDSLVFHQKTLLKPHELPSFWEGTLADPETQIIPTKWFGAYTYLTHPGIRIMLHESSELLSDRSDGHLVDMTLSFPPPSAGYTPFTGSGRDYRAFTVEDGKLTPLPDVAGIPGWKKVRFVKEYRSHRWVYEGVMLPGNNMILGHWGHCLDEVYFSGQCGPFMFWAAPEGSSLEFRDNRVALSMVGTTPL